MTNDKYKICKLNEVAWFQEGPGVRKSQFRTSGVKLLNVGNICDRELNLDKTSIYISEEEAYGRYKHFLIDEGDLLIASSGIKVDYFDKKITFARKEHLPLCMNTSTIRFKVIDKTVLDINYLRHFLASRYFTKQVQFHITGSAQLNFGPSHLNKMTIILPPLEEQKKIARILDKADEIRTKKRLANAKLDEFLKSTFISMFGDPVSNPNNNKETTIGEICHFVKDGPHKSPKYQDRGIPFISVNNIISGKWNFDNVKYISEEDHEVFKKRCHAQKGDILYTKGGTTGFAKYVDIDLEFSNWVHVAVLKFDKAVLNGRFFEAMLNSEYCYKQSQQYTRGIANRDLVLGQMKMIKLYLPPIEEQNKFAKIVEKVEEQKQKNEQVIEQMDNLFNSLSQQAFKGEL